MRSWELQKAIIAKLSSSGALMAIAKGVYDFKPQPADENNDDADFPYVVVGEDDTTAFHTDDATEADAVVLIHFWDRHDGRRRVKQMEQAAQDALDRQALTLDSGVNVDCFIDTEENYPPGADQATFHGLQRYRYLLTGV